MNAITIPFKPLLAALALVVATSACQRDDDVMTTPTDDPATVQPAMEPADAMAPPPPTQEMDPCAGLMGTQLDECVRRQNEMMTTPPMIDETQPVPPQDPMDDTTTQPTDPNTPTTPPQQ